MTTEAARKAKRTGQWAKIMAKWLISFSTRGGQKWQLVSFEGAQGGESRGIVDFIAIRKDFGTPPGSLKAGDAFEIVLIQSKGGAAANPTPGDVQRLIEVARLHRAREILLADWEQGRAPRLYRLIDSSWEEVDAKQVFGPARKPPVKWLPVERILEEGVNPHGVEFRHDAFGEAAVAFIEGDAWHRSPELPVRVRLLKGAPVEDVKAEVLRFLSMRRAAGELPLPHGGRLGNVSVGYNA